MIALPVRPRVLHRWLYCIALGAIIAAAVLGMVAGVVA